MNRSGINGHDNRPLSPAMTLREACRKSGFDEEGVRCAVCAVREMCDSDERWIVSLNARSRLI